MAIPETSLLYRENRHNPASDDLGRWWEVLPWIHAILPFNVPCFVQQIRFFTGQVFLLGLIVGLAGCGPSLQSKMTESSASIQWDHQRLSEYLADVPGIRKLERWDEHQDGLYIETDHYRIKTTLADPLMLRQVPAFVESAYKAYQSQLPDPVNDSEKFETYLFGQRAEWEAFTQTFTGSDAQVYLQIRRGAYALNSVCVAYNIGRKQTFSILGHEGWHQFVQRHFRYRLPSWLDEGVATLFETCQFDQGVFEFRPQDNLLRLGTLKQAIQQGHIIPLRDLITMNPGQAMAGYGSNESAIMTFYAQNYALVRFLREYNYGQRLNQYHTLLLGGLRGNWQVDAGLAEAAANREVPLTAAWNRQISTQLFQTYITGDAAQFEAQYRQFCHEIVYNIRINK